MTNTNASNLRKNLFGYLDQAIQFNEVINVNTKNGNAVILSEEDYRGLMETCHLMSSPGMKESLIKGMNTPTSELEELNLHEL